MQSNDNQRNVMLLQIILLPLGFRYIQANDLVTELLLITVTFCVK